MPSGVYSYSLGTPPENGALPIKMFLGVNVASRIIKIVGDKPSVFLSGDAIQHPHGLLVHDGQLIVGGWGLGFHNDFNTDTLGQLLQFDLKTKRRKVIAPSPTGHLDGIESDSRGGYIVTDWIAGKLLDVSGNGKTRVIQTFPKGLADHAYLADRGLLILPEMLEGKLTAYRFSLK